MNRIMGDKISAMVSRAGQPAGRPAGQPAGGRRYLRQVMWILLGLTLLAPGAFGEKKKKKDADQAKKTPVIDYSNIVWPNPPPSRASATRRSMRRKRSRRWTLHPPRNRSGW